MIQRDRLMDLSRSGMVCVHELPWCCQPHRSLSCTRARYLPTAALTLFQTLRPQLQALVGLQPRTQSAHVSGSTMPRRGEPTERRRYRPVARAPPLTVGVIRGVIRMPGASRPRGVEERVLKVLLHVVDNHARDG